MHHGGSLPLSEVHFPFTWVSTLLLFYVYGIVTSLARTSQPIGQYLVPQPAYLADVLFTSYHGLLVLTDSQYRGAILGTTVTSAAKQEKVPRGRPREH